MCDKACVKRYVTAQAARAAFFVPIFTVQLEEGTTIMTMLLVRSVVTMVLTTIKVTMYRLPR